MVVQYQSPRSTITVQEQSIHALAADWRRTKVPYSVGSAMKSWQSHSRPIAIRWWSQGSRIAVPWQFYGVSCRVHFSVVVPWQSQASPNESNGLDLIVPSQPMAAHGSPKYVP